MNIFPHILMRIGGISFEKLDALCIDTWLFDKIYEAIELQNELELENQFNQELIRIRENIKKLSKETALRNGLVLSAPSLLDRMASYQKKEIAVFRKKEKQTERTIVQYLTRMATKTSPFSTFNQIGLAELKEQCALIENAELTSNQSFVRINNYILKSFRDSIVQERTLVRGLNISVNSTLKVLKNGYEFLVNDNNIEAFQTIGTHPVVQFILDKLEFKKNLLLSELIAQLQEEVDAEIEDLEDFVLELHEIGLLEFEIGVSNLDEDWADKCLDLLETLPKCQLSEDWTKLLLQLLEAKHKYRFLGAIERIILLKKALIRFEGLFEQLTKETEKHNQPIFKKQFDNHLKFSEMNLLYEDYAVYSTTSISKNGVEQLFSTLNEVINALQSFQRNEEFEQIEGFYKRHYNNVPVDLLDFYKVFSKWKILNKVNHSDTERFNKRIQEWQSVLKSTILIENDNTVNIEIKDLQQIILDKKEKKENLSHSAFVQLYQSKNQFHCFLSSVMPGYGKYFSRFLHLFPEEVTKQLQECNIRTNQFFAEINDDSFFNANIHPPLMPYEIRGVNDNTQVRKNRQLLLKDIKICLVNGRLNLVSDTVGKVIVPFDLGFQALAGRSELFKLLNAFSEAKYSPIHQIINVVNDLVKHQTEIHVFPRITIENQITIQRKTWVIPRAHIPQAQQKHETEWTLYKRVLNWVKENNLPLEGFYTINPKELAKNKLQIRNTDAYKPQYINFKNPILVQLFIRGSKKIETSLKLEEFLPSSEHLLSWNQEKHVSEFLLEWQD